MVMALTTQVVHPRVAGIEFLPSTRSFLTARGRSCGVPGSGPICHSRRKLNLPRAQKGDEVGTEGNKRDTDDSVPKKSDVRHSRSEDARHALKSLSNLASGKGVAGMMESAAKFLAPRKHGDIRDVTLVSLSFAVLVYISQRLVCAYCAFMYMAETW